MEWSVSWFLVVKEAKLISRSGKASTNKKNWYNIEYTRPEELRRKQIYIDIVSVKDLQTKIQLYPTKRYCKRYLFFLKILMQHRVTVIFFEEQIHFQNKMTGMYEFGNE